MVSRLLTSKDLLAKLDCDNSGEFPASQPMESYLPENAHNLKYAIVRGSCYLRRFEKIMHSVHRRKLSTTRRNKWVGFRPAYFPARVHALAE